MKPFRLSRLAEADLEEIWLYVARDRSIEIANRLIDEIMDRILLVARPFAPKHPLPTRSHPS